MKYSEARQGRIFVIRLEDGDILHEQIEKLAKEKEIKSAFLTIVGGVDKGSRLVVGPEDGRAEQLQIMEEVLDGVHEVTGSGTLFPDETGNPVLHMHLAGGRGDHTVTGCVRNGVKVWHVLEVILVELLDSTAVRKPDSQTGFKLLNP